MANGSIATPAADAGVFDRLPSHILDGLSREQRTAIGAALRDGANPPPVNIRLSLPFFGGGVYFNVLAGRERRNRARIELQRQANPLRTAGNMVFALASGVAFYAAAAGAILFYSTIVEL